MAYNGYGYSNYQHSSARQTNTNPTYSAPRQVSSAASASHTTYHNTSRQYDQTEYDWQGQDISNMQGSNGSQGGSYWMPPSEAANQTASYQQQRMTYRNSDINRESSSHQFQGQIQHQAASQASNAIYNPGVGSVSSKSASQPQNPYYQQHPQQNRNSNPPQPYQSSPIPLDAINRPDSAQSSRNAAATAMTALSSRAYSQGATSGSYPAQLAALGGNTPSVHSNHTERHEPDLRSLSSAALLQGSDQPRIAVNSNSTYTAPTKATSVPIVPQHSLTDSVARHTSQRSSNTSSQPMPPNAGSNHGTSASQVSMSAPYASHPLGQYNAPSNVVQVENSTATDTSAEVSPSPPLPTSTQASLPSFVDPSQIYNPYNQEYEHAKAVQIQAETRRAQALEAEAIAQREQEQQQSQNPQPAAPNARASLPAQRRKSTSLSTPKGTDKNQSEKPKRKPRQRKSESAASAKSKASKSALPPVENSATGSTTAGESGKQDDATEMMRMLEMMREKNPDLFQKMVADMNVSTSKTQTQQNSEETNSTGNPTKPTTTKRKRVSKAAGTNNAVQTPKPTAPNTVDLTQATPTSVHGKSPAKTKTDHTRSTPTLKTDPTGLPDLGRFPAARRKRGPGFSAQKSDHTDTGPSIGPETTEDQRMQLLADFVNSDQPQNEAAVSMKAKETNPEQSSQLQSQPQPPALQSPQDGGIWPHSKRQILSEAAAQYLSSIPNNKSKEATSTFMLSLIDQNPSYIELCELLEAKNYTLNRVHFAKHLLKAMPDLSESSQSSDKQTTKNPAQSAPPPRASSSFVSPNSPTITKSALASTSKSKPTINSLVNPPTSDGHSPRVGSKQRPTPPGTDEPSEAPLTHQPNLNITTPTASPLHLNGSASSLNNGPSQPLDEPATNGYPPYSTPYLPGNSMPNATSGKAPTHLPFRNERQSSGTAPANRRLNPKLRVPASKGPKSAPNSKEALARKRNFSEIVDLTQQLSDSEQEPEEPPHRDKAPRLDIAKDGNVAITDLQPASTITLFGDVAVTEVAPPNTNAPPPNQTAPEPQPSKTIDFAQYALSKPRRNIDRDQLRRRADIVKPIDAAKALVRSYYDPRTVARDILIATGRHPMERGLNHHLLKLREKFTFVNNSADLETFRWDLVDPGGPPPPQVAAVPLVTRPALPSRAGTAEALLDQKSHDDTSVKPTTKQASHPDPSSHLQVSQAIGHNNDSGKIVDMPEHSQLLAASTPEIPRRRGPGRPPGAKNKTSAQKVEKTPRQTRISIPSSSPSKPPRPFQEYRCQWDNCDAKLHNFAILRKHVLKLHVASDDKNITCLWKDCKASQALSTSELSIHLDREHMSPTAWKLGDGPTTIGSGFLSMDYETCLYDEEGRNIVPKASTKGAPPSLILPAAYASIREFNKMHGYQSDRSKALEVMRSLETKQATVGVGLNRGGCTMMNPTRLKTVASFENIFTVRGE